MRKYLHLLFTVLLMGCSGQILEGNYLQELDTNGEVYLQNKDILIGNYRNIDYLTNSFQTSTDSLENAHLIDSEKFDSEFTERIFELVNKERQSNGLFPLSYDSILTTYAKRKNENMIRYNYFAHHAPDNTWAWDWMEADGVAEKFRSFGENLAWANFRQAPEEIMNGWMNSEGHRANILHEDFTEIGIAVTLTEDGELFATQHFGTRQNSATEGLRQEVTAQISNPNLTKAIVTRIIDGDTIEVEVGGVIESVRLIQVDAPERGEIGYEETNQFVRDLLPIGTTVWLESGVGRDRSHDRLRRYVWLNPDTNNIADNMLNARILTKPHVHSWIVGGRSHYSDELEKLAQIN